MRLFFAISFPEFVREHLEYLSLPVEGLRWIATPGLHLTLQFIGKVDAETALNIREVARTVVAEKFDLNLLGTGAFPKARHPKVLWAGCDGPEALFQLQGNLLTTLQTLDLNLDTRPFSPHITLGRVRRGKRPDITEWLEQHKDFSTETFEIQAFHLYSSELRSSGAVYHVVESYPLTEIAPSDPHPDN